MKKSIGILIIVLFQLVVIGCKNTQEKANDFVNNYNNTSNLLVNNFINSTSAKLSGTKNIEIRLDTNAELTDSNKQIYSQIAPNLMTNLFTKDKAAKELIEEGSSFFITIYSSDNQKITSVEVNKKKLDELLKLQKTSTEMAESSTLSPELKEMLTIMNQSLPIENKAEGTKITKIDINASNELEYTVEVYDEYAELIKGEEAKSLIKESILRSPDFRRLIQGMRPYGISTIKYYYIDSKGKKLTDIMLNSGDLR